MTPIRTFFWGTHDFAANVLSSLLRDPQFDIIGVVTQPDKPVGRKKILTAPSTKTIANEHDIPVYQPETLKGFTIDEPHDIAIVAQYGKIIPERLLILPTHDTLNVHTSLLPAYRGATPVQSAIAAGDETTGVTIMKMDKGMDTGPILLQKTITIPPTATTVDIYDALVAPSIEALHDSVPAYIDQTLQPQVQDESQATICNLLSRDDGRIDWTTMTAQTIYNRLRAFTPWPGIWTTLEEKRIKILTCTVSVMTSLKPGEIAIDTDNIHIGTIEGSLDIASMQFEGKPAMTKEQLIAGYKHIHGKMMV